MRNTYKLRLQPWRPDQPNPTELDVSTEFFTIPEGTDVVVVSKPGRLGLEWVVRIDKASTATK